MIALVLTCIYAQKHTEVTSCLFSCSSPLDSYWTVTWCCDCDSFLLLCWVGFLPIYSECRRSLIAADERGRGGKDAEGLRWRILSKRSPFNRKKRKTRDVTRGQHLRSEDGSFLDATLSWLAAPAGDRLNCEDLSPHAHTESTQSLHEQQDGWVTATQNANLRRF